MRKLRPWAIAVGFALAAASCARRAEPDAHYHTRGLVKGFQGEGVDARAEIHHERIEAFKDRDGKPSPMESMSMNFALGPGVDAASFKPGAKVAVDFDVRWSNSSPLLITRAEVLPESTSLVLADH